MVHNAFSNDIANVCPSHSADNTNTLSAISSDVAHKSFRIGLIQSGFPSDGNVISQVRRFCTEAAEQHCDIVVFPENLMCPYDLTAKELLRLSEPISGPFMTALADVARECNLWIVGTMSEWRDGDTPPYNTAFVLSAAGTLKGTYRKCHLYDAHGVRESDRMSYGDMLAKTVRTPFCTLGLAICYDLRFPETARSLALQGADLILFPSAWHDGPHKEEHWKTLLRARAIENEVFVAGVCHAGERYVGRSLVANPLGTMLCEGPAGIKEAMVTCDIDLDAIATARDAMPIMGHRRPELYGSLTDS